MAEIFDPYHRWLGIPTQEQPPNHYRLLGLQCFEADPDVIEAAADQRAAGLRLYLDGRHRTEAQALLKEVAAAKVCLLLPERKKAYDQSLAERLKARSASEVGSQLGEYLLEEKVGEGGMGVVYRARHLKLGRMVAIKILAKGQVEDRKAIARFEREIAAIGRIEHPHIVQALDAREIGGTRFLVMEYVEGLHLGEILRRCGRLTIPDAAHLACQTALGLQAAHEHGLVHRDVKPSNIMLMANGMVKLLDLGLVRMSAATTEAVDEVTASGQAMGTIDYMAPEQIADSRHVDIRADIYSLGCTFYKLLSGKAPFAGSDFAGTLDKLLARVQHAPRPIEELRADVPPKLSSLLRRMLAIDPTDRFPTPADAAEALRPWTQGSDLPGLLAHALRVDPNQLPPEMPPPARGDGLSPATGRSASPGAIRSPWRVWLKTAAATGALLLVFGLTAAYFAQPARAPARPKNVEREQDSAPRPRAPTVAKLERPSEPKPIVAAPLAAAPKPAPEPMSRLGTVAEVSDPPPPPLAKLPETNRPSAPVKPAVPPETEPETPPASAPVADGDAIARALAEDRYDAALEMAAAAYREVMQSSNKDVRKAAMDRRNRIQRLAQQWTEYQAARDALGRSPGDAAAHLTAGRWFCFSKGDWGQGLAHLTQGSDAELRTLAVREQAPPQTSTAQAELADAWWEAGKSRRDEDREAMLRRAVHWYRLAELEAATGLVKIKIQRRLDEAAQMGIAVPNEGKGS